MALRTYYETVNRPAVLPPVTDTNVVFSGVDNENAYGCLPCPSCRSKCRAPHLANFYDDYSFVIHCDDCGFEEKGIYADWLHQVAYDIEDSLDDELL